MKTTSGTLNHLSYLAEMYVDLIFHVDLLLIPFRSNSAVLTDIPRSDGSFLGLLKMMDMSMTNSGNCSSELGDS